MNHYNFSQLDKWKEFTLSFKLDKLSMNVEFRGIVKGNSTDICLDYIKLRQIILSTEHIFNRTITKGDEF